jgi:UDP-glucuronate 4-epimerase
VTVIAFDPATDPHRLRLIMTPEQLERIKFIRGDVTDLEGLERVLGEHEITNVIHLAGLQLPFCRADPPLGAGVNVVGTVNLFEAVKLRGGIGIGTVTYASSAAVWNPAGTLAPLSHYGIYKIANEGTARIYAADGVSSIGLRPYVVYGPGRDQGVTSGPTLAMQAAARREPYEIAFGGRSQLHYAPDTARAFIQAARSRHEGAAVFDLGGPAVHVREIVSAIEAAAPESAGLITYRDEPLPFPAELDAGALEEAIGPLSRTPLDEGVRETIELFR